jgi:hypothetical protein
MRVTGNCTPPLTDRRRRCSPRDPSALLRRTGSRQDARVSFAFTILIAHTFWKKSASLQRWNEIRANLAQQVSFSPQHEILDTDDAIIRFSRRGQKIKYSRQISCAVEENLEKICQVALTPYRFGVGYQSRGSGTPLFWSLFYVHFGTANWAQFCPGKKTENPRPRESL